MKKLTAIFLVIMLSFSLLACSVTVDEADDGKNEKTESNETETPEEETKKEEKSDEKSDEDTAEITFTELVAVDNDECSIKITEIDPDGIMGYTLKAELENKSSEKDYWFSVESASINGVECDPFFASEVAAGKKANEEISFYDPFDGNDIGDYTDIKLTFKVYDIDNILDEDVAYETVHIYPYGEDSAISFVRATEATDNVVVDNEYISAVVTGYEEDDIFGYSVNLYLINKSDTDLYFTTENTAVNGYMADPFFVEEVCAGNCSFTSISWSDTVFDDCGIEEVEEIEFILRAYDLENWNDDDYAYETVTLNP